MKINRYLHSFLLTFFLTINSAEISSVLHDFNKEHLQVLKKNIASELKINKYTRIACVAAIGTGVALGAGLIIKHKMLMNALENSKIISQTQTELANAWNNRFYTNTLNADLAKDIIKTGQKLSKIDNNLNDVAARIHAVDIELFKRQQDAIQSLGLQNAELQKKIAAKWNWMPGFPSILSGYVGMLVNSAIVGFLSSQMIGSTHFLLKPAFKAWGNVFHDGNIQWYVTNKIRIKKIYNELEALSEELATIEEQDLSEKKREKEQIIKSIIHVINCLTLDTEKLVAFMLYKHDLYKIEYPFAANGMSIMAHNVIEESTIFIKTVQQIIEDEEQHAALIKAVKKFYKKLNAHKRGFMMYEEYPEESFI